MLRFACSLDLWRTTGTDGPGVFCDWLPLTFCPCTALATCWRLIMQPAAGKLVCGLSGGLTTLVSKSIQTTMCQQAHGASKAGTCLPWSTSTSPQTWWPAPICHANLAALARHNLSGPHPLLCAKLQIGQGGTGAVNSLWASLAAGSTCLAAL